MHKIQKFLPVGALGVSLIIHLAVFLGISGMVLIQSVKPKLVPIGEYDSGASTEVLLPPELIDEQPEELTPDVLDEPQVAPDAQFIASDKSVSQTNTFKLPIPLLAGGAPPLEKAESEQPKPDREKRSTTPRVMVNPFNNGAADLNDGGITGRMYDFKQTKDRKPSPGMAGDPDSQAKGMALLAEANKLKESGAKGKDAEIKKLQERATTLAGPENQANQAYRAAIVKYINSWPEQLPGDFYQADKPLNIWQLFIPTMRADEAPAAFKVQQYVKPRRWIIVYRGSFVSPASGTYRFIGLCDDILVVNFKGKNVLDGSLAQLTRNEIPREEAAQYGNSRLYAGSWFQLEAGQSYPLRILIGEQPGGVFYAFLMIQKKGEPAYPSQVFQLAPVDMRKIKGYEPGKNAPLVAKDAFICE
jgi:hypothetical protein